MSSHHCILTSLSHENKAVNATNPLPPSPRLHIGMDTAAKFTALQTDNGC